MTVLVPTRRVARRNVSPLALLVGFILRVPFRVQLALVCVLAAAFGALIGTLLGGADAARDLGLLGLVR